MLSGGRWSLLKTLRQSGPLIPPLGMDHERELQGSVDGPAHVAIGRRLSGEAGLRHPAATVQDNVLTGIPAGFKSEACECGECRPEEDLDIRPFQLFQKAKETDIVPVTPVL
ncbi:hypothetical protein NDU88_000492 [Pleurodeles waltl]|uniref:Uncharacterized protein n=1 Tax=Pleurodeles waltl TaxID=8319 RepID=A0AAV7L736_PLEWA|nr:hypothetical protein NDU88_000492 [Pleurodeles waltl]